eukprot:319944_1
MASLNYFFKRKGQGQKKGHQRHQKGHTKIPSHGYRQLRNQTTKQQHHCTAAETEQAEETKEVEETKDAEIPIFRSVKRKYGKTTHYCFLKGCRFWWDGLYIAADGGHRYICTHMRSVNMAHCAAVLWVYFYDEEEKGTDGPKYKSHRVGKCHDGSFEGMDHEMFDAGDIALMDFREDVKYRIDKGLAVHAAYHESAANYPTTAENWVKGFESLRGMAYRHAAKDGTTMPSDPADIGKYLEDQHLDGNFFDQVLARELYDKEETKESQIKDWTERRGKFYIGDGKKRGKYQFWCPKWGAEQLATGARIYIDVSFKSTPRISQLKIPYQGVLHLLVGHKNENNKWVPHTTPCASILLQKGKSTGQVYLNALKKLWQICRSEYKIDIINHGGRTDLIVISDMEEGLKQAVQSLWNNSRQKICAFHFAQALRKKQQTIGLSKYFKDNIKVYWYFRNFFMLWAVPLDLVRRCYDLLVSKADDPDFGYRHVCEKEGDEWIEYFRDTYMINMEFAKRWNHWYEFVRTNNELENRNGQVNLMFGPHPYINKFAFRLAKWYNEEYIQLMQYLNQGYQRRRRSIEVLKNDLLKKCWDWLEELGPRPSDNQLIIFLKYCNVAMKGEKKKLEEILARKEFWKKERQSVV